MPRSHHDTRAGYYLEQLETYERQTGERARDLKVKGHLLFKWMMELGTTPTLLDAIEDLIGPNIMLTTSAVWPKNARDPAFVTWHQDSAYFGYEPAHVWSAWIGITHSTIDNGCLRYLPGAHLKPEMPHLETFHEDNLLSRGQYIPEFDESTAVDAEVKAGEATLHHFRLPHSSKPNPSDQRRIGILFVYCPPMCATPSAAIQPPAYVARMHLVTGTPIHCPNVTSTPIQSNTSVLSPNAIPIRTCAQRPNGPDLMVIKERDARRAPESRVRGQRQHQPMSRYSEFTGQGLRFKPPGRM